ncbi:hypothetical protein DM01DRAFT_1009408 [Hesseltinella vesiculosa]|uniref:Uncharacterized protein n=1 Tax=Hesseltinella vesiculosa TaxID=101127 RepID=A0A1X2GY13_9FUNG|nr:hypothetical protein DM01DRAFT_1009408 [Hesseltinella vesiculosa]
MGKRRAQQLSDRPSTKPLLSISDEMEAKEALILEIRRHIKAKLLTSKDHGKTKTELDNVLRLPKGLLKNIDDACHWKPGFFTAKYNKKFAFMAVWKSTLNESFASLSSETLAEVMATSSTDQPSSSSAALPLSIDPSSSSTPPVTKLKEEIRGVHKGLTSILASHFKSDTGQSLKNEVFGLFKTAMSEATNYCQEMTFLLQATMLKFATTPSPDWYNGELKYLSASDLVPVAALRHSDELSREMTFFALPPPTRALADDLFSIGHIQYLFSSTFGKTQASTKTNRPVWSYLDVDVTTRRPDLGIMTSELRSIYNNKMETNVQNLLSGKSFKTMLRYLLRLLLRLWLAPQREKRHHDAKANAAAAKAAKTKEVEVNEVRQLKKQWSHVRTALRRQEWQLAKDKTKGSFNNVKQQGYDSRISHLKSVLVRCQAGND